MLQFPGGADRDTMDMYFSNYDVAHTVKILFYSRWFGGKYSVKCISYTLFYGFFYICCFAAVYLFVMFAQNVKMCNTTSRESIWGGK